MSKNINKKWNKFVSSLNEIREKTIQYAGVQRTLNKVRSTQLEEIFEGTQRVAIPITAETKSATDYLMLNYVNQVRKQGWTINLDEPFGYATKVVESRVGDKVYQNKKKVKLGPLIIALGPEAEQFWIKNSAFYTSKQNELYFAAKYSVVISRAPMDILRMSDHDGWSSCHSVTGGYFRCAVSETLEGGAIAYVVSSDDLTKVDLQAKEIFKDPQRNIEGISPISRIRIRRFRNMQEDIELGVPERRVYTTTGQGFPNFYSTLAAYLLEKQRPIIDAMKEQSKEIDLYEWEIIGGSYEDTHAEVLFTEFLGAEFDNISGTVSTDTAEEAEKDIKRTLATAKLEEYVERTLEQTNFDNIVVNAEVIEVEDPDDDVLIDYGGVLYINIPFQGLEELDNTIEELNSLDWRQKSRLYRAMTNSIHRSPYIEDATFKKLENNLHITMQWESTAGYESDFDSFIADMRELDEQIEDSIYNIRTLFLERGYIQNRAKDLIEEAVGTFKYVEDGYPKLESRGCSVKFKQVNVFDVQNFLNEVDDKIQNLNYPDKVQFMKRFETTLFKKYDNFREELAKSDFKNRLSAPLFNKDLYQRDRQLNLFRENKNKVDFSINNFDTYFNFEIINYSNELLENIPLYITVEWIDGEGEIFDNQSTKIDEFLNYVRVIDNQIPSIVEYIEKGIAKVFKDSYLETLEFVESWLKSTKTVPFGDRGSDYWMQQKIRLQENKKKNDKIFNLDGATWRMK